MSTKRINGFQLEQMAKNGLALLQTRETEINRLNVFPVSDGDTGTNMRLTLENGLRYAKTAIHAGEFLKQLSEGMLLGARGNSGVILSQFFKGFYLELARCSVVGVGELRNALIRGYRVAYRAVVNPVEGTIISVTREGIEHIRGQIVRTTTIEQLMAMYVAEMKKTLSLTPEMLPVLKEAGVVDSGAMGFIAIAEGMLKYLYGEIMLPQEAERKAPKQVNFDLFNENSAFIDGYCMEFILQLMKDQKYNPHFRISGFIEDLKLYGNSIVAVQDGTRVKVHIHTLIPAKVITLAQEFGEFLTFKLENMQVQHNEHDRELTVTKKHKKLAVVAVVNGEGMKKVFADNGCDVVIDGGSTMNTSSQEFIDAFAQIDADAIAVLPNNPNIILAAEQAVSLYGAEKITVLPSRSIAEGYFAMAMDIQYSDDVEYRLREMREGLENTVTLCETTASRDYAYHEISCKKGEEILLVNNKIVCVNSDPIQAVTDGLGTVEDIDDRDTCIVFRGEGIPEEDEELLRDAIEERFPLLEVEFVDGGQSVYHWVIGLA